MFHLAIQPGRKVMTRFPVEYNVSIRPDNSTYSARRIVLHRVPVEYLI